MKSFQHSSICLLLVVLSCFSSCRKEDDPIKKSNFIEPGEYLTNPSVKNSIQESGILINNGDNPPSMEGTYITDGEVTAASTKLSMLIGEQINSEVKLYNQTAIGTLDFQEKVSGLLAWGSGGFVTGSSGKFTIWQESRQSGSNAGLPDDISINVVLIMSGTKMTNGNLTASGISIITEVITTNKNYDIKSIEGAWWMWKADLNILGLSTSTYEAAYTSKVPTIDGQINTSEWSNGNTYIVTFIRPDGNETKLGKLCLQHDGTWLYIGLSTEVKSGWDVYLSLKFDGNHDHKLAANKVIPHYDINVEYPSPDGWSGYVRYDYLIGSDVYPITPPTGTLRKSSGLNLVSYEFKIALSDVSSRGQTFGLYIFNYSYPIAGIGLVYDYELINHGYEFPTNLIMNEVSKWAHIKLN